MLSIITACSRRDNLQAIYDSMDFRVIHMWYIIYDTSKGRSYTHQFKGHPKIKEIDYDKEGVCGHPQINHAIDLIEDGFVYIVDDDNVIHPDFWKAYKDLDPEYIYTWDQNRVREKRVAKGGKIQKFLIDTSQFIVPRKYIGDIRWDNHKRNADFKFINTIHKKYSEKFKYINKILCYHNYLLKKIAVCFWGLSRSLKFTESSIEECVFKPLKDANIHYDVFLHTYKIHGEYKNPHAHEHDIKLDNTEYKLLEPTDSIVENQDYIFKKINPKKYTTKGNPWELENKSIDTVYNFILSLWSLKQVTSLWLKNEESYTHVMYCRPDVTYITPLDTEWFTFTDKVYMPDFARHGFNKTKVNDRFAIGRPEQMKFYGNRFDEALDYSKKRQMHSETFLSHIIKKHKINLKLIKFDFIRTRATSQKNLTDVKELIKKKRLTKKRAKEVQLKYTRKARKLGLIEDE
jgi:hypothetical protein